MPIKMKNKMILEKMILEILSKYDKPESVGLAARDITAVLLSDRKKLHGISVNQYRIAELLASFRRQGLVLYNADGRKYGYWKLNILNEK